MYAHFSICLLFHEPNERQVTFQPIVGIREIKVKLVNCGMCICWEEWINSNWRHQILACRETEIKMKLNNIKKIVRIAFLLHTCLKSVYCRQWHAKMSFQNATDVSRVCYFERKCCWRLVLPQQSLTPFLCQSLCFCMLAVMKISFKLQPNHRRHTHMHTHTHPCHTKRSPPSPNRGLCGVNKSLWGLN